MKRHLLLVMVFLLAGFVWTGCQEPPTEEMAQAQQALTQAEGAEAATYAQTELDAATAALDAANAEVKAQGERFALARNYEHAQELLTQAQEKAEAARTAAVAGKAKAKAEAEAALAEVEAALDAASADLTALGECPKKPKGFAADLETLTGRLEALSMEVAPIEAAIAGESFSDATALAKTLSDTLSTFGADLTSARETLGC